MDKSDLEDGEVTNSDIDEPTPLHTECAADTLGQRKPAFATGDVIDITVDTASSSTIIEIPSDDNAARPSTARNDLTSQKPPAVDGSSHADGDGDRRSRTSTKRRNQKRKQKEKEQAKKSKTEAQIAQLEAAEMDEYELLCVRGASPPRHAPRFDDGSLSKRRRYADTDDDDDSDSGAYDRNSTPAERRERRRKRGGGRRHQLSGSADDVASSAASVAAANLLRQPRKMELCKFFLTGMCAKTAHCTYMHEDFPCKFFYLGIPHKESDCIFAHGPPLEPAWQGALLKHVERAPTAILGRFPKAYKTNAAKMLRSTHERMMAAISGTCKMFGGTEVTAAPTPATTSAASDENGNGNQRQSTNSNPFGKASNSKQQPRACDESGRWSPSGKLRPLSNTATGFTAIAEPTDTNESGRWSPSGRLRAIPTSSAAVAAGYAQTTTRVALLPSPTMPLDRSLPPSPPPQLVQRPMSSPPPPVPPTAAPSSTGGRCVDLMADILNADQLARLRQLGVEYISQVDNLTVAQLNEIGLSIAQIHQIQMCSLQASATATTHAAAVPTAVVPMLVTSSGGHRTNGDVDMRIPAMAVASTMSTTFQTPYTVTVAAPPNAPLTSDLAAPPPKRTHDALPNNGHYGINDMAMDAVADEDSDDGDDDDDDDTDGQLVINDDDATGDENNA